MNPHAIHRNVLRIIDSCASRAFLIDSLEGLTYSYSDFHCRACSLAELLRGRGIRKGDRVAIFAENSPEFVASYFACLYLGATAVPVSPQLHDREVRFILEHCGMHALLFCETTRARCMQFVENLRFSLCLGEQTEGCCSGLVWSMKDSALPTYSGWQPFDNVGPADLFSITFTSGTTGQPKGVPHSIRSLLENAVAFNKAMGYSETTCMYHVFNMAYMAGFLNTLLCPFLAGGTVVIGQAFDTSLAVHFWDKPIKYGVNALWLVPTIVKTLLKMDRGHRGRQYCRQHIKTICVGTAALPHRIGREFEDVYGVRLFESYGLSELLFVTTNTADRPFKLGSVGRPIDGIEVGIVDEFGSKLRVGETGEIVVRTPHVMAGYLDYESGLPDDKTAPKWFATGDVGHLCEDGYLFITDRKKDIIIRGGLNISPRAVEMVLDRHPQISEAAVVGLPHDYYGEEVVAAVRLKDGAVLAEILDSVRRLCKENLNEVSVPTTFFQLEQLPIGTTGKLHKGMLRERIMAVRQKRTQPVPVSGSK
jgi:acyl-CoA synthetase (AMP-forming)/AMP-acid ligase II